MFRELELPNLQRKNDHELIVEDIEFNDIRKTGLMGNIDKKKTLMSAFKRNALWESKFSPDLSGRFKV